MAKRWAPTYRPVETVRNAALANIVATSIVAVVVSLGFESSDRTMSDRRFALAIYLACSLLGFLWLYYLGRFTLAYRGKTKRPRDRFARATFFFVLIVLNLFVVAGCGAAAAVELISLGAMHFVVTMFNAMFALDMSRPVRWSSRDLWIIEGEDCGLDCILEDESRVLEPRCES